MKTIIMILMIYFIFKLLTGELGIKFIERLVTKKMKKAANKGNPIAQSNLGFNYHTGKGIVQDFSKAFYWFEKAANKRNPIAQSYLGQMYYNGYGVTQDYSKAYVWINVAVVNNEDAKSIRDDIIKDLSPEQVKKGQKLSQELYNKIYK